MADPVATKKKGRKPEPAIFAVQPAPASESVFAAPAMTAGIVATAVADPVVIAAEPVSTAFEPIPTVVEAAAVETVPVTAALPDLAAEVAEPALEPDADLQSPVDETPIASADAEPLLKGPTMATTYDTAAATTGAATDKAKALFGDFNERAKTAMEKSTKLGEEVTEFTKGNVEALVASSRVAAKGAETIAQDVAESMKKHFESTTATMKSFASVKSPTELFQLQSDYAKTYFDGAVAEASKFSESMMKLMGDIAQPLSSRYALAAEKFKAPGL